MKRYYVLILIALVFILLRIIFRRKTKNYKTTEGKIVDFKTEKFRVKGETSHYIHHPIIEFVVDGKEYRCVKSSLYNSPSESWRQSLVANSLGNIEKVRYNPEDPKNNYALYSLKDLKYNFIMIIPIIIVIIVLFIIFAIYGI